MSRMHRHRLKQATRGQKQSLRRHGVQLAAAVFFNGFAAGFPEKKLFTGGVKGVCVPVLNCYSCPGAVGACPIGALQAVAGGARHKLSFYVLGMLALFGVVCGRLICGFLCPFGFVQDLLYKLPTKKIKLPKKLDRALRFLKYGVLLIAVLLLPAVLTDQYGLAPPYFCKYFCPVGTLQGGIPHLLVDETLRSLAGGLFWWKMTLLLVLLVAAVFLSRCFCRYFCPLGAFYALFNRVALYRLRLDQDACVGCGKCEAVCPMAVDVRKNINSTECIRCGKCRAACPADAIEAERLFQKAKERKKNT